MREINRKLTLIIVFIVVSVAVSAFGQPAQDDASGMGNDESSSEEGKEYVFGPDDVIRITVDGHPEWTGEFIVKPDGTIAFPLLGDIKVKGLNRDDLTATLSESLSRFINNPRVMVDTVRYISQTIYILGEVNRPGEYPTGGKNITLKDAIVMAGLPGRFAATGRVYVISPSRGKPSQRVVNLYRILYRGEMQNNIEVKPGDIVYVPQTLIGKLSDFISAIFSPLTTVRAAGTPIP